MAPVEVSASVAATPATIWTACFEPMKWEGWDPDLKEMQDVIGPCEDGTTCTFLMNDGNKIPVLLSNVVKEKSLTFSGGLFSGLLKFEGKVLITAEDVSNSKIDYSFAMSGIVGSLVSYIKKSDVVGGTQGGLDNMVKLSEAAQKK